MAILDDISITASGDIRYEGTTENYTVIALHRILQDLADDAVATSNEWLDITDDTPSARSTDNIIEILSPYNIDDTLAQHLYDGSIIQSGGDEVYDGIVNFGVAGIHIEVMQDGSLITPNFWTTGLNPDANAGISHRFLVKVRTGGNDIDGRKLLGLNREFNYTYGEFPINGTSNGNNVLALTHSLDLNNEETEATVSGWTTIDNTTEGYANIDVTGDLIDEYYYSEWNKAAHSINDFYERMKWLSRRGSVSTLYGLSGDIFRGITHEVEVDTHLVADFSDFEAISWATGTGQMFAVDEVAQASGATKLWMQLLTGNAPTDGQVITGGTSGATVAVNTTVTPRDISTPFVGASTGSAIIGAYGLGIESGDLVAADKVTDLDATLRVPPNNVQFTLGGLENGKDRVLITNDASGINETQLSLSGAHTADQITVTVQEAIPTDTKAVGTLRMWNGDTYSLVDYTSWVGSVFSGCTGVPDGVDGDNIFLSYIDKLAGGADESFTVVYASDRTLFIRVRYGNDVDGIKTFETTGTLKTGGGSSTCIRTPDV